LKNNTKVGNGFGRKAEAKAKAKDMPADRKLKPHAHQPEARSQ
jgi:hypothetical protein